MKNVGRIALLVAPFLAVIAGVAVAEGDGAVVHGKQGSIGHRGAVDVAAEVFEDLVRTVRDRLGEDDPSLVPRNGGEWHAGEDAPREVEGCAAWLDAIGAAYAAAFGPDATCYYPGGPVDIALYCDREAYEAVKDKLFPERVTKREEFEAAMIAGLVERGIDPEALEKLPF